MRYLILWPHILFDFSKKNQVVFNNSFSVELFTKCTMGCFLVHLLRNSEMLPNYSGSIAIMKTRPNQKKIIKKSEKKSFTLDGI